MPSRSKDTHTPNRVIRVPEDLWQAAKATAAQENTTVSAAIIAFLRRWTKT